MSVGISTTMTPESYRSGELDKIIELAKPSVFMKLSSLTPCQQEDIKRKDLIDNHDWVEDMIRHVKQYNENLTYPGILVYAYVTSHRSVGCSCGASYCYISPYGEMMSCDFNHAIFGNVLDEPLYKVWERMTSHEQFASSKWGGCKIKR